jgi:predicted MFS family arabinose efflux permease
MSGKPLVPVAQLMVAWLTVFLVGTELFIFSPLLPMLATDYHISATSAGISVTIFSFTYMISAPLFGYLSDQIGRRRVLTCSLMAFGAANLLTASAGNWFWLLAVRLFAGAAAAGVSPSVYALVGSAAPQDRRATWLAIVVSGLLAALAIGASTGALAGAYFGCGTVFAALAAVSLALACLNCRVWPCERRRPVVPDTRAPRPLAAAVLARRLMPMVAWSTGLYSVYTYLGTGLVAVGFSTAQTAQAILSYGCGAIAGVLIGGRVTDRLGAKFTTGASLAGLCACFLLLRLALDTGRLVGLALGLSSAVAQLFFPAQQAGLANDFPSQSGTALAWNNSALFLGISLGSLVGGEVVAIGSFDANLTIAAGIALIGCIINTILVPAPASLAAGSAKNRR